MLYTFWVRVTHPFASLGKGVSIHYTCDLSYLADADWGSAYAAQRCLAARAFVANNKGAPLLVIEDYRFIARRSHIAEGTAETREQSLRALRYSGGGPCRRDRPSRQQTRQSDEAGRPAVDVSGVVGQSELDLLLARR